jgi:hypothetical protein
MHGSSDSYSSRRFLGKGTNHTKTMFAFKTLERRLIVLLVVPLTLFLLGFGFYGYHFIHGLLFKEWREVAILRLERAAHQIDMKLGEHKEWMAAFARAGQDTYGMAIQRLLLQQIKSQPGVTQVKVFWKNARGDMVPAVRPALSAELSPITMFIPRVRKPWGCRGTF